MPSSSPGVKISNEKRQGFKIVSPAIVGLSEIIMPLEPAFLPKTLLVLQKLSHMSRMSREEKHHRLRNMVGQQDLQDMRNELRDFVDTMPLPDKERHVVKEYINTERGTGTNEFFNRVTLQIFCDFFERVKMMTEHFDLVPFLQLQSELHQERRHGPAASAYLAYERVPVLNEADVCAICLELLIHDPPRINDHVEEYDEVIEISEEGHNQVEDQIDVVRQGCGGGEEVRGGAAVQQHQTVRAHCGSDVPHCFHEYCLSRWVDAQEREHKGIHYCPLCFLHMADPERVHEQVKDPLLKKILRTLVYPAASYLANVVTGGLAGICGLFLAFALAEIIKRLDLLVNFEPENPQALRTEVAELVRDSILLSFALLFVGSIRWYMFFLG